MKIEVQEVSLTGIRPPVLCYCRILVDDWLCIASVKLCRTDAGKTFVSMPNVKHHDGKWCDLAFPVNPAGREALTLAVTRAYGAEMRKRETVQS